MFLTHCFEKKKQTKRQTKNKTKEFINPDTTLDSRFSSISNSKRGFELAMHKASAVAMERYGTIANCYSIAVFKEQLSER